MDIVERIDKFQSTSSVWRETAKHEQMLDEWVISIHALRAEGDGGRRAACGQAGSFQSTPSVRRATARSAGVHARHWSFQSTPSVRRATFLRMMGRAWDMISIHALHTEGDS